MGNFAPTINLFLWRHTDREYLIQGEIGVWEIGVRALMFCL
jgi:hypothetical protein